MANLVSPNLMEFESSLMSKWHMKHTTILTKVTFVLKKDIILNFKWLPWNIQNNLDGHENLTTKTRLRGDSNSINLIGNKHLMEIQSLKVTVIKIQFDELKLNSWIWKDYQDISTPWIDLKKIDHKKRDFDQIWTSDAKIATLRIEQVRKYVATLSSPLQFKKVVKSTWSLHGHSVLFCSKTETETAHTTGIVLISPV